MGLNHVAGVTPRTCDRHGARIMARVAWLATQITDAAEAAWESLAFQELWIGIPEGAETASATSLCIHVLQAY